MMTIRIGFTAVTLILLGIGALILLAVGFRKVCAELQEADIEIVRLTLENASLKEKLVKSANESIQDEEGAEPS